MSRDTAFWLADAAKIGDWLQIAQQNTRFLALLTAQFGACHRFSPLE
jgi:hypothetical protein